MRGLGKLQANLQAQHDELTRQLSDIESKVSEAAAKYAKAAENVSAMQQSVRTCMLDHIFTYR